MRTIMTFPLSTCITLVQRYEDQLIWTIKYNQNLILEKFNPIVISLSSEKAIIITTSTTAELWWARFHCFSRPTLISIIPWCIVPEYVILQSWQFQWFEHNLPVKERRSVERDFNDRATEWKSLIEEKTFIVN